MKDKLVGLIIDWILYIAIILAALIWSDLAAKVVDDIRELI